VISAQLFDSVLVLLGIAFGLNVGNIAGRIHGALRATWADMGTSRVGRATRLNPLILIGLIPLLAFRAIIFGMLSIGGVVAIIETIH
jgi:ABC-type dipeptide/oligopeptide/nickel transport system permease component